MPIFLFKYINYTILIKLQIVELKVFCLASLLEIWQYFIIKFNSYNIYYWEKIILFYFMKIKIIQWVLMNNFKFWWSKIIKYLKNIEYSTLTIHSKLPIFPQINEEVTKQGDFLFSKNFTTFNQMSNWRVVWLLRNRT